VPDLEVRPVLDSERGWLRALLTERWGGHLIVGRGATYRAAELDALVALAGDARVGALTFHLDGDSVEIVTLDALREASGVGRALVEALAARARSAGAERLRVMTTNDNTRALRFYQRAGFRLVELRAGAVQDARRVKPSIPVVGLDDIPIRDELDLVRDI